MICFDRISEINLFLTLFLYFFIFCKFLSFIVSFKKVGSKHMQMIPIFS